MIHRPGAGSWGHRRARFPILFCLVSVVSGVLGLAGPAEAESESSSPRERDGFALVLGGGGARGLAHIGVLLALEELEMVPSFIAGTSIGAIIGSMYAAGHPAAAIDSLVQDRNWLQTLLDEPPPPVKVQGGWQASLPVHQFRLQLDRWPITPPSGASEGQSVEALVGRMTADALFLADRDFDRLPIPFRCVATDLMTGEAVIRDHGVLARLVRASGGLPLVFVPVEYEGQLLLDGGLADNLPLRVARAEGYQRAVVVDVSNVFVPLEGPPDDLISLARRAAQLASLTQNQVDLGPDDVMIRVDLRQYNLLSFWAARAIVRAGYDAAMAQSESLRELARGSSGAQVRPPRPRLGPVEVAAVLVRGNRRLSDWSVRKRFDLRVGDRVELAELWRRAEALSRQSIFDHAWIDVLPLSDGRARVELHVKEHDQPELEVAGHYRDGEGPALLLRLRLDNRFGAGSARTLSWRLGDERTELRLDTSVPVRGSRRVEARVEGGWINERAEIFDRGDEVDAWDLHGFFGGAHLALALPEPDVVFLLGMQARSSHRRLESGGGEGESEWRALEAGVETWTGGGLNAWPAQGFALHAAWGLDVFGGNVDGWRIEGGFLRRTPHFGRWGASLAGGGAWGSADLPVELQARVGGPRSWVGRQPDEIIAPRLLWGRLGVDHFFNREWRVEAAVASGWYGRIALDEHTPRPAFQLQTVWDSAIGPVHLGWSMSPGRSSGIFLDVGHEF